jgi:hypothetical protein
MVRPAVAFQLMAACESEPPNRLGQLGAPRHGRKAEWRESRLLLGRDSADIAVVLRSDDDISVLGDFPNLTTVDIAGASTAQIATLASVLPHLTTLSLRKPRIDSLEMVGRCLSLRELAIANATKVSTLEGLGAIKGLEVLLLDYVPRVTSLDPLRLTVSLQELGLKTLASQTSSQLVDSLGPLRSLRRLRRLEMRGVVARDRSLRPLWDLRQLRALELSNHYDVAEVGKLTGALPGAQAWTLKPYDESALRTICKKCGQRLRIQTIGRKRGHFVCLECDWDQVARHIEEFEHWREVGEQEAIAAGLLND